MPEPVVGFGRPAGAAWILLLALAPFSCRNSGAPVKSNRDLMYSQAAPPEISNGQLEWPLSSPGERVTISEAALASVPITRPIPEVTIGSSRTDDQDHDVGAVHGIAVDKGGRIYVWDSFGYRIREYTPFGEFIRDIGRRGMGPGEFIRPTGTLSRQPQNGIAISGDTLYAIDQKLRAFHLDGSFLASSTGPLPINNANSVTATRDGVVGVFGNADTFHFITFTFPNETIVDSFTIKQHFSDFGVNMRGPNLTRARLPYYIAQNGGYYFAVGDSFRVDVRDRKGRLMTSYRGTSSMSDVTGIDKRDYVESAIIDYRRAFPRYSDERFNKEIVPGVRRDFAKLPFAKYRQTISSIITSDSGTMLLKRPDITNRPYRLYDSNEFTVWTLINSAGRVRSHIELPNIFTPKVFLDCSLYGVSYIKDGSEMILRYDLRKAGCVKGD